jgi:hypothetical protein
MKAEDIDQVRQQPTWKVAKDIFPVVQRAAEVQREGARGWMSAQKTLLDSIGLSRISPLWNLEVFSLHYFYRFGACCLHMIYLGNQKKHIQAMITMLFPSKANRSLLNQNVRLLTSARYQVFGMQFVPGIVGDQTETDKKLRKLLCLQAGHLRTFCMIAPILFHKFATPAQYNCFTDHLESDILLGALGHTPAMLDQAYQLIVKWQTAAVEQLTVREWRFPNFAQERNLPALAKYAGPIWSMNTAPMERKHKLLRELVAQGNGKQTARDLLNKVNRLAHDGDVIQLGPTASLAVEADAPVAAVRPLGSAELKYLTGKKKLKNLPKSLFAVVRVAYERSSGELRELSALPLPPKDKWTIHHYGSVRLAGGLHVKVHRALHLRTKIPGEAAADHFIVLTGLFTVSYSSPGGITFTHEFARGYVSAPLASQPHRGLVHLTPAGKETIAPLSFGYEVVRPAQVVDYLGSRICNLWPAAFAGHSVLG